MFAPIEWAIFSLLQGKKRTCRVERLFNSFDCRSDRTLYFCRALPSVRTRRSWRSQKSSNKRASVRLTRAKTFYPCWFNRKENLGFAVKLTGAKVTKIQTNNQVFVRKTGNISFENKSHLKGEFFEINYDFSGGNLIKLCLPLNLILIHLCSVYRS